MTIVSKHAKQCGECRGMGHTVVSITERVAELTLAWIGNWISWVRVPLVFTEIHVAITVGVDHTICTIKRIELEVILPTCRHAIIIVILVIDLSLIHI